MKRESSMMVTLETPAHRIAELNNHQHIHLLSMISVDLNSVTGRDSAYGRRGIGNPLRITKSCSLDSSPTGESLSRPLPLGSTAGSKTSIYKKCSCLA
jgi:hypothetical protein